MKLHRNLLIAIIDGLNAILLQKKQADSTVEHIINSNKSWGSRDRNFIAENIYDIIRYKRRYAWCIDREPVDEESLWQLLGARLAMNGFLTEAHKELVLPNPEKILQRIEEARTIRKIWQSIPDWLDELGEEEMGTLWEKEIEALNGQARLSIRVNTLKTNKEVVKSLFVADNIPFEETTNAPDALVIGKRKNFGNFAAYKNGLFEIQDVSSQLVAPMLELKPRMTVIDACAGAGGKTLHIAALMKNSGSIIAIDIHQPKLDELKRRAFRAGCTIIKTMLSGEFTQYAAGGSDLIADRILLDVPCSGIGVLRRKPDAKWSLSNELIAELKKTQALLLDTYAPMLKPDGLLIYSTCSILPSENEKQIESFLERTGKTFELVEEKKISPVETGFDGFYIGKIRKR